MSLRLLIDEDSQAVPLVRALRVAGHDVLSVQEAGRNGASDPEVLEFARVEGRIVITHNCDDFGELHDSGVTHAGIVAVFRDRDRTKNMTWADIAEAIDRLEKSGWNIGGEFVVLNMWRS